MDSLGVGTHDQEGVQPDERVPAQGMIPAAEQERFVRLRIQAWKELLGWDAGAVYLCDARPWGRPGGSPPVERRLFPSWGPETQLAAGSASRGARSAVWSYYNSSRASPGPPAGRGNALGLLL